jgi:O-antigen/teichoic acid export membrane protein
LLGRRFAREVLTLQVGSFATMGIQFVTSVVIANLLGPSPLGVYYQARALLDLVNMLANLAVGQALITPLAAAHAQKNREEALRILAYFLKMGLTVSLFTSAVGLLAGNYLGAVFLDDPQIGDMARVLFVTPPLLTLFNMATLALQSSRQVGRLTLLENGYLMSTSLLNVAVVVAGGGVNELLYSVAFATLLTAVASLWMYSRALPMMPSFPPLLEIVKAAPRVPYRRYFAFSALVSVDKNFANLSPWPRPSCWGGGPAPWMLPTTRSPLTSPLPCSRCPCRQYPETSMPSWRRCGCATRAGLVGCWCR